jgi:hypothetical protein
MSDQRFAEPMDEATLDLLIKQAVEGLEPAEQRLLDALDDARVSALARELERAAAAATLVGLDTREELPPALRARIEAAALERLPTRTPDVMPGVASLATATPSARGRVPPRSVGASRAGWWAAAACLALAILGWWRPWGLSGGSPAPLSSSAAPSQSELEKQRAGLEAQPGTVVVKLGPTAAGTVQADIVWNEKLQQGVLRVSGLAANDPAVEQYQLWIFDAARDARYPVDGGVFDIPAQSAPVLIPIRARLAVHSAAAFAVTVEKPGGVVVSARDRVVALGKVSG